MEEKEKNKKTLVAIIAGLIIGGLLVWVFSSAPNDDAALDDNEPNDAVTAEDTETEENISPSASNTVTINGRAPSRTATSEGSVLVQDQPAGAVVALGTIEYPENAGWIVVREETESGDLGNILGAARFNEETGLHPTEVRLLRETEPGETYHVMVYSENGDGVFDLEDDAPLITDDGEYVGTTFETSESASEEDDGATS